MRLVGWVACAIGTLRGIVPLNAAIVRYVDGYRAGFHRLADQSACRRGQPILLSIVLPLNSGCQSFDKMQGVSRGIRLLRHFGDRSAGSCRTSRPNVRSYENDRVHKNEIPLVDASKSPPARLIIKRSRHVCSHAWNVPLPLQK